MIDNLKLIEYKALDNKKLISVFKRWLKSNSCCKKYPKCGHPKIQSNNYALDIQHEEVDKIRDVLFQGLRYFLGPHKVVNQRAWILYVPSNETITSKWHTHLLKKYKDYEQVSALTYLTKTDIGTQFEDVNYKVEIKPKLNHWYFWPSKVAHKPMRKKTNKDRMILAADFVILRNKY